MHLYEFLKAPFGKKGRSGNHSVVKWFDRQKRLLVKVNHWLPGEKKSLTQVLPKHPSNSAHQNLSHRYQSQLAA